MEATKIVPTVGRVVWFWPPKTHMGQYLFTVYGEQPCAAQVAYVHSDNMVNLSVFDHAGQHHSFPSVHLINDGEPAPEAGGYCQWMPYQIGQAKRST